MKIIEIIKEEFEKSTSEFPNIIGKTLDYTTEIESKFQIQSAKISKENPSIVILTGSITINNRKIRNQIIKLPLDKFQDLYNKKYTTWKQENGMGYGILQY